MMKSLWEKTKQRWSVWIPWCFLALGFGYDMRFLIVHGRDLLDSDLAAEMVLSHLLNEEHSILSRNWYYSTELRVFQSQWLYRIGLLISPNDWHIARVIATSLLYVILIAAYLFFARYAGLGRYAVWGG